MDQETALPPASKQGDVTFRSGPLVVLPDLLEALGLDAGHVLGAAGFRQEEFGDPDHRLDFRRTARLLAHCVAETGREDLGLLIGERAQPAQLGIVGFLAFSAPTVELALRTVSDHLALHDEASFTQLEVEGSECLYRFGVALSDVPALLQIYDLAAVMVYKLVRGLCGDAFDRGAVYLNRKPPNDLRPYRAAFDVPVFFDATVCGASFPTRLLSLRPPGGNDLLFRHLVEDARAMQAAHAAQSLDALPALMRKGLMTRRFSAEDFAELSGLHVRTLHRRLRAAGTTFRQELDRARFSLCQELLLGTRLSIQEIATMLGYADSSGLIRAFRRWCGESPQAWRRRRRPVTT